MKNNRLKSLLFAGITILTILGASPSHAIPMRIIDGTYTLDGGDPVSITGTIDFVAPDAFTYFPTIRTDIYLDGYYPVFSIYWEGTPPEEVPVLGLYYGLGGTTYDPDMPGYGNGSADYIAESYDPDVRRVTIESWEALQFGITLNDYPDIGQVSLRLTAAAPVPEPATITLLGIGLLGLAGATRNKLKR